MLANVVMMIHHEEHKEHKESLLEKAQKLNKKAFLDKAQYSEKTLLSTHNYYWHDFFVFFVPLC